MGNNKVSINDIYIVKEFNIQKQEKGMFGNTYKYEGTNNYYVVKRPNVDKDTKIKYYLDYFTGQKYNAIAGYNVVVGNSKTVDSFFRETEYKDYINKKGYIPEDLLIHVLDVLNGIGDKFDKKLFRESYQKIELKEFLDSYKLNNKKDNNLVLDYVNSRSGKYSSAAYREEMDYLVDNMLKDRATRTLLIGPKGSLKEDMVTYLKYLFKAGKIDEKFRDRKIFKIDLDKYCFLSLDDKDIYKKLNEEIPKLYENNSVIYVKGIDKLYGNNLDNKFIKDIQKLICSDYFDVIGEITPNEYNESIGRFGDSKYFDNIYLGSLDRDSLKDYARDMFRYTAFDSNVSLGDIKNKLDSISSIIVDVGNLSSKENPSVVKSLVEDCFINAVNNKRDKLSYDDLATTLIDYGERYKFDTKDSINKLNILNDKK